MAAPKTILPLLALFNVNAPEPEIAPNKLTAPELLLVTIKTPALLFVMFPFWVKPPLELAAMLTVPPALMIVFTEFVVPALKTMAVVPVELLRVIVEPAPPVMPRLANVQLAPVRVTFALFVI